MDRRVDPRLDVRLPCHVAWRQSRARFFVGLTENMSRSGILVRWQRSLHPVAPRPGDLLTAEIELPPSQAFGRRCMHCEVTVVRVTPEEPGALRVALQVNQMQFRNYATGRFAHADIEDELSRMVM